eukprot:CAMPEP_0184502228 /NCGR_PEP_ID=MMETSP0113_2-20130426/49686_1 /TAXON_ID=91329 /ORGANISM="Norrisiella sphaerica, Strain BC52" /LENGTH=324 /DNA_ID=CAMNT_0026891293 /DNA_START=39 /DNA_END=1013 /DNA_ORIENTATION=+
MQSELTHSEKKNDESVKLLYEDFRSSYPQESRDSLPGPSAPRREELENSEDDNDTKEDGEEKLCRICFDGEPQGPMIAPCRCAGGQKWIHRRCLDDWRSQEQIPHAFTRCPTCHFEYVTEVITPQPTTQQKAKYTLLVIRDILGASLLVVASMFLLAVISSASDPSPRLPLLHLILHEPLDHKIRKTFWPYLVSGAFLFLAILGFCGIIAFMAYLCNGGEPCNWQCEPCHCYCYNADPYCCWCCCEGGGGGGAGARETCECCACEGAGDCCFGDGAALEGEGALACIAITVVILAMVGIIIGIVFAVIFIQNTLNRHMRVRLGE